MLENNTSKNAVARMRRAGKGTETPPTDFLKNTLGEERERLAEGSESDQEEASLAKKESPEDAAARASLAQLLEKYQETKKYLATSSEGYFRATLQEKIAKLQERAKEICKERGFDASPILQEFDVTVPTKAQQKDAKKALERLHLELNGYLLDLAFETREGHGEIENYLRRAEQIHAEAGLEDPSLLEPFITAHAKAKEKALQSQKIAPVEHTGSPTDLFASLTLAQQTAEVKKAKRSFWDRLTGRETSEQKAYREHVEKTEAIKNAEAQIGYLVERYNNAAVAIENSDSFSRPSMIAMRDGYKAQAVSIGSALGLAERDILSLFGEKPAEKETVVEVPRDEAVVEAAAAPIPVMETPPQPQARPESAIVRQPEPEKEPVAEAAPVVPLTKKEIQENKKAEEQILYVIRQCENISQAMENDISMAEMMRPKLMAYREEARAIYLGSKLDDPSILAPLAFTPEELDKSSLPQRIVTNDVPETRWEKTKRFFRKTFLTGLLATSAWQTTDQKPLATRPEKTPTKIEYAAPTPAPETPKPAAVYREKTVEKAPEKKVDQPQATTPEKAPVVSIFKDTNPNEVVRTPDAALNAENFNEFKKLMKNVLWTDPKSYLPALQMITEKYQLNKIAGPHFMKIFLELPDKEFASRENINKHQEYLETVSSAFGGANPQGYENHMRLKINTLNYAAQSQENFNTFVTEMVHEYVHAWEFASQGMTDENEAEVLAYYFMMHPNELSKWRRENFQPKDGSISAYPEITATFPQAPTRSNLLASQNFEMFFQKLSPEKKEKYAALHEKVKQEAGNMFDEVDDTHKFEYAKRFERRYQNLPAAEQGKWESTHTKVLKFAESALGITSPNELTAVGDYFSIYDEEFPEWVRTKKGTENISISVLPQSKDDQNKLGHAISFQKRYMNLPPAKQAEYRPMFEKMLQLQTVLDPQSFIASKK